MKVLFITTGFPWGDPYRGGGTFFKTQADALVRKGVHVEVVSPVPYLNRLWRNWRIFSDPPPEYFTETGIRVFRPRILQVPGTSNLVPMHLVFARAVLRIAKLTRPDIIHAYFGYPPGLAAIEVARKWNISSVLSLLGSDVNVYPYRSRKCRRKFIRSVQGQKQLITNSHALAIKIRELTGMNANYVPIGADPSAFSPIPDKPIARTQLNLPHDAFILLYVGNLIQAKGVHELVEAQKELEKDGVFFVFVGSGPLSVECKSLKSSSVRNFVPNVAVYLAASDALILPSYREGMPQVLVEGGFMGIPIIASAVGNIVDFLSNERGLIIEPKSVKAVVEAVRSVKADPEQALSRARRLLEYVKKEYDVNQCIDKIIKIYSDCINAPAEREDRS